jgi:hypothetical protein
MIRRSGARRLQPEHERELIQRLQNISLGERGTMEGCFAGSVCPRVRVQVYSDQQLPSFIDTLRIFHGASLIVAPHGAGLSNSLFAPSSTAVLELLTVPMPNCFSMAAAALGQQYCGFLPRTAAHDGEMRLEQDEMEQVVHAARQLLVSVLSTWQGADVAYR